MLVKVSSLDLIPSGTMKQFYVGDREVLIINIGGRFYGLSARCAHAGAPLAEGTLNGEVLTCPWHYSQYKITDGSVLRGPAEKNLESFAVIVKANFLFIEV